MDPSALRAAQGLAGEIDVVLVTAGERRDHGPTDLGGDLPHAAELILGRCREAGLDDVDSQGIELTRQLELLLRRQAVAGGLLAVAESSVEDQDFLAGHTYP